MSTTANEIERLIGAAEHYLQTGNLEYIDQTIEGLVAVVRELCPLAPKKPILVANPNVDAWRPHINAALTDAIPAIILALGHTATIKTSTYVRRAVMKDGGVKVKLFFKFEAKNCTYRSSVEPRKIIQRIINDRMAIEGLPKVAVTTTCGSQMSFNARVHIQGDEDYDTYLRFS